MKKRVIAYLHTHWDREWYREFEIFRMRLLRVFDEVLDALEQDLIPSFYFDGQVVALLDYLKIRPENEQRVRALIKSRKLFIGPFYCLVDEFLTSATLFKKNLEYGLSIAREFGCEDFTGYLPDTFGHSDGVIKILKEFGLNEAIVWRGCPKELPAEFVWQDINGEKINGINLLRGYFMDIFTADLPIIKKAEFLNNNLNKIAEKSGEVLLLPIGADHLGIPLDVKEQIALVNTALDNYEIELGSLFDYIEAVKASHKTIWVGELRDNSATFTLEGSYSARADLKQMNIIATHQLERATRLVKHFSLEEKYDKLLEYAYKLLLKNQAHDSICGCSTDDTHYENVLRYKKIEQITSTMEVEIKYLKGVSRKVLNLGNSPVTGVVELKKSQIARDDVVISEKKGFDAELLNAIRRVPITEDYLPIFTTLQMSDVVLSGELKFEVKSNYVPVTGGENFVGEDIFVDDVVKIGNVQIYPKDFKDFGDSYNRGVLADDNGQVLRIKSCKNIFNSPLRVILDVEYEDGSHLEISKDAESEFVKLNYEVDNKIKNHHLFLCIKYLMPVTETLSEDMNRIIKREFDSDYDIRNNLPQECGQEAKTNTAPCQRLVWANGVGAVLKGVTQYEVFENELRLSVLRATGVISNPKNPTRTTPAGPPLETPDGQLLKTINQEIYLFESDGKDLNEKIEKVYNFVYVG